MQNDVSDGEIVAASLETSVAIFADSVNVKMSDKTIETSPKMTRTMNRILINFQMDFSIETTPPFCKT